MEVQIAITDTDILKCWHVMFELRPHLKEENFLLDAKNTRRQPKIDIY